MPKEIIIIKSVTDKSGLTTEAWGSLTRICEEYTIFQYHTIKKYRFPFEHKGFNFKKVKYNSKHNVKK